MFIEKLKTWGLGLAAGIGLIATAFLAGRRGGSAQATAQAELENKAAQGERTEAAAREVVEAVQERREVEHQVQKESRDEVHDQLNSWTRRR